MFRNITIEQARKLGRIPYHYVGNYLIWNEVELKAIIKWSDEVEMKIFYTPGFLYFENKEDRLNFRLKWC